MVTPDEVYRASEEHALEDFRFLHGSVAETARVREMVPDDWEIQELCRSIIFEGSQNIKFFMEEIERVRQTRKEPGRIPG